MRPFKYTVEKVEGEGETEVTSVQRRMFDLDSVLHAEEVEIEQGVNMLTVFLNLAHDMQMIKKQSAAGKPQEFIYAQVPMTIKIFNPETIEKFFNSYE
jgi:hypothetical protein